MCLYTAVLRLKIEPATYAMTDRKSNALIPIRLPGYWNTYRVDQKSDHF